MNIRWIERLTPEGRAAQFKRDVEPRDRFMEIVLQRLKEIPEAEAVENPWAVAMIIERTEAVNHPFLYAVHLCQQWWRDIHGSDPITECEVCYPPPHECADWSLTGEGSCSACGNPMRSAPTKGSE